MQATIVLEKLACGGCPYMAGLSTYRALCDGWWHVAASVDYVAWARDAGPVVGTPPTGVVCAAWGKALGFPDRVLVTVSDVEAPGFGWFAFDEPGEDDEDDEERRSLTVHDARGGSHWIDDSDRDELEAQLRALLPAWRRRTPVWFKVEAAPEDPSTEETARAGDAR